MDPLVVAEIAGWNSAEIKAFFETFLLHGSNWVAIAAAVRSKSVEQIQRFYQLMTMLALAKLGDLDFLLDVTTGEGAYVILRLMWHLIDTEKMETLSDPFVVALRERLRVYALSRTFPPLPARSIKLKLCPRSDPILAQMQSAGFTPSLQLRLSSTKTMAEVVQYIESKWKSPNLPGSWRLYPPQLSHVGWDASTLVTVQDTLNQLGAPDAVKFTFYYDLVPIPKNIASTKKRVTPILLQKPPTSTVFTSKVAIASPSLSSPSKPDLPPQAVVTPLKRERTSMMLPAKEGPPMEEKQRGKKTGAERKRNRVVPPPRPVDSDQKKRFWSTSEMAYVDPRGNLMATFSFPRAFTAAATPSPRTNSSSPEPLEPGMTDHTDQVRHDVQLVEAQSKPVVEPVVAPRPGFDYWTAELSNRGLEIDPAGVALSDMSLPPFDGSLFGVSLPPLSPVKAPFSAWGASVASFASFPAFSQLGGYSLPASEPKENAAPPLIPLEDSHQGRGNPKRKHEEAFELNTFLDETGFVPFSSLKRSRNDIV